MRAPILVGEQQLGDISELRDIRFAEEDKVVAVGENGTVVIRARQQNRIFVWDDAGGAHWFDLSERRGDVCSPDRWYVSILPASVCREIQERPAFVFCGQEECVLIDDSRWHTEQGFLFQKDSDFCGVFKHGRQVAIFCFPLISSDPYGNWVGAGRMVGWAYEEQNMVVAWKIFDGPVFALTCSPVGIAVISQQKIYYNTWTEPSECMKPPVSPKWREWIAAHKVMWGKGGLIGVLWEREGTYINTLPVP